MQKAISMEGYKEKGQLVISYQTIRDTQQLLNKFRRTQSQYQQYHDQYLKMRRKHKEESRVARMWVSHFIQVLNLSIVRGEMKKEIKAEYGLDPERLVLPPLWTDHELELWGKKVIEGEEKRIGRGGVPIYNPNIAKVKVYWSIFAEHYYAIESLKKNAEKFRLELAQIRPIVDDLLRDLWTQVESFYAQLPLSKSIEKCTQFGLIYSLSLKEKKQIEADKLQGTLEF